MLTNGSLLYRCTNLNNEVFLFHDTPHQTHMHEYMCTHKK